VFGPSSMEGNETGMFEVPAGGRRYRALELLVKQKRMAKTQPVPCVVRDQGLAEDDSLAENDERVGLHPLDQFRAFQILRGGGLPEGRHCGPSLHDVAFSVRDVLKLRILAIVGEG
jgi:hypothetical protein